MDSIEQRLPRAIHCSIGRCSARNSPPSVYIRASQYSFIMCQYITPIYTCTCVGANYIQKCTFPSLTCVENLQKPTAINLDIPCSKHKSKRESKVAKTPKKEISPQYPPTAFTKKIARRVSSSQLRKRSSNRSTVPPRTPTSTYNHARRASVSSSVYSDASVAPSTRSRSASSRAESYIRLLDLGPLSLEQSASLAEARANLRKSVDLDNRRRTWEGETFDSEIAPIVSGQPTQRIKQTILNVVDKRVLYPESSTMGGRLSPRTANTHPALRDQLSPRRPSTRPAFGTPRTTQEDDLSPLSPTTIARNKSMKEKAARIRASLEADRRPASTTATSARKPTSPIKKREYNSWTARPSHTRNTRSTERPPPTPSTPYTDSSRTSYEEILEEDIAAINQMTDREKYQLFLEKDRKQTAIERQRRAARKARGGRMADLRNKTDGICSVM